MITFHSLEDRLVKNEFRNTERWDNLTSKPIVATPQEQRFNPRSRSAKLRVARKKADLKPVSVTERQEKLTSTICKSVKDGITDIIDPNLLRSPQSRGEGIIEGTSL